MNRRGFLKAILATACAPAIVKAGSLMTLRPMDQAVLTLNGWADWLHISKGTVRYTENYVTMNDLLDAKYEEAIREIMRAEDRQFQALVRDFA